MNEPIENHFSSRPAYVLGLPLKDETLIIHPEQVILKIGSDYMDVGALCYALRSNNKGKRSQPAKVVLPSLLKQRPAQILKLITVLSTMLDGRRPSTISSLYKYLKALLDWADTNGHTDCLAGGNATRNAFRSYAAHVEDRFRRQEIGSISAYHQQKGVLYLLEAITGLEEIARGVRLIKQTHQPNGGTEPVPDHDFAQNLAISQMLFDGLSDLVLENRAFPFKLELPESLGWEHNHLWLFPVHQWRLPPHRWSMRKMQANPNWAYDYQNGRLATVEEIWRNYSLRESPKVARTRAAFNIRKAQRRINNANANSRDRVRFMLGMIAHNSFCYLLHANSGGNQQPILDLETDGMLDTVVTNQGYRSIKFRASGKEVFIPIPISFLPSLRRFLELRTWLLNGTFNPYLFITYGPPTKKFLQPQKASNRILEAHYNVLLRIEPKLKRIRALATRATVNDALLRKHDASIVAKVMGHSEATELMKYGRGSVVDHRDDMTTLFQKISAAAKKQRVIPVRSALGEKTIPLEQGGGCAHYGYPDPMTDAAAFQPDCGGGCWFCGHRLLVADEEDARKLASASFVMLQLILGPQHEAKLRPLISKCESDLETIAQTFDCRPMVERIKKDVHEDGNLTRYWAEKYLLFLELQVIV
ncbi:site-specific integrase [Azospira inquinata]|uniref:Integrase n=1 Tax=Azospira inquinata TaxID=2785627 RepID=A0A975SPU2_9RHOO|nr:hypothetical protein [Azospira inquinata]QWT47066.1 hypothetical protein J8L76_04980 [Azospira inquinata]QWT50305.1 hypothetical protein Azoinq_06890 [Azospira inquinata]